jgi:hypothetical protein
MKLLAGDFVPGSGNKILAGTERRRTTAKLMRHLSGAAREIRTPDPIITNDVNFIPTDTLSRTLVSR